MKYLYALATLILTLSVGVSVFCLYKEKIPVPSQLIVLLVFAISHIGLTITREILRARK